MRRKKSYSGIIFMIGFMAIIGGVIFLYNAKMFERDLPVITVDNDGYWNLKSPLEINIEDTTGIRSYKVSLQSGDETFVLASEQFIQPEMDVSIEAKAPKRAYRLKSSEVVITIEATDGSKWNFLGGNTVSTKMTLQIDKKRPFLTTVTNSYAIMRGGSALVIFKANDDNLDSLQIETNFGKVFHPQPFYKEGYYASLVAWPVTERSFRATIVAKDLAGNVAKTSVPFRIRDKSYRVSKIKLSDRFLDGKIAQLAEEFEETDGVEDRIEKFKIINETVREKNEILIHDITSKVSDQEIKTFNIKPFYPLKNAQKVASFGDHRHYYYKGEKVSESYHLGLDLASVKMGKIMTKNPAVVVFSEENGLYGNMLALHHGMGLYTIYGHCSSHNVQAGDQVGSNKHIANTGMSGYAMGDHLHFGVLVQGIEVRPEEWMDKQWIRLNISEVMSNAKKIIKRQ